MLQRVQEYKFLNEHVLYGFLTKTMRKENY